ncbi:class I SAM-dependent methyltransferase family protein [Candidatus Woesearchaeota archaeon]|nr:class I SAM-dependent methyltransferase family protein [Candidatus Woesearchaeota archaeon]
MSSINGKTTAVKIPAKDAQKKIIDLKQSGAYDNNYIVKADKDYVYVPVTKNFAATQGAGPLKQGWKIYNLCLQRTVKNKSLKESISENLDKSELELAKTSYDIVGDIAILEIDNILQSKKDEFAKALLKHKNINTVLRKSGGHEGQFRTQKMEFLAGDDKRTTTHKENGLRLMVDVENAYFSVRLSNERLRIYNELENDENVLVMFSGVGPYSNLMARKAKSVVAVEINPRGYELAEENKKLNKNTNLTNYCGDAKIIVPNIIKIHESFDRVLMPLPKGAEDFLDTALSALKPGGWLHFYDFLHEEHFIEAENKISSACANLGRTAKIIRTVKCGQNAPHIYRICVDAII